VAYFNPPGDILAHLIVARHRVLLMVAHHRPLVDVVSHRS
jgi:hypothetical protein